MTRACPSLVLACFAAGLELGCHSSGGAPPTPPDWPTPVLGGALPPVDTSSPDQVVGDGTAGSCTEQAFETALAAGGVITFDCGASPVVVTMTSPKSVTVDPTVIDGGGLVTLSGGDTTRILVMDTGDETATAPSLTVQNITLQYGHSTGTTVDDGGGAIFYRGGSVTAIDSQFLDNRCDIEGQDVAGGAIFGIGAGETRVSGTEFGVNRCSNGGAIGSLGTAVTIVDSTFIANEATGYGGSSTPTGLGGDGGALWMDGTGRTLSVAGTDFEGNLAGANGSVVFRTGHEGEPSIFDTSTFDANLAQEPTYAGRATLYLAATETHVQGSTFSNNQADAYAGIWAMDGDAPGQLHVRNTTMVGNATSMRTPTTTRGIGGAITVEGSLFSGSLEHCTITGNAAQYGAGVVNAGLLTIHNSIVANDAENTSEPPNCTGSPGMGTGDVQWPTGAGQEVDCVVGVVRGDPMMGALGDNGGPTQTAVPGNAGLVQVGTDCLPNDQRGRTRGDPCTIGALEL